MKTYVRLLCVSALLALFAVPVLADDVPPSEESVCDELIDGTPGLFGLCNAYCEAQDCDSYPQGAQPNSCTKLLISWDRKATGENDPELPPCLDQGAVCPCWATDANENGLSDEIEATANFTPFACYFDSPNVPPTPAPNQAWYESAMVLFNVDPFDGGGCTYANATNGLVFVDMSLPVGGDEYNECLAQVLALHDADWGGSEFCNQQ